MITVVTNRAGNVAEGAKSMLNELGVEWVEPERLPHLGTGTSITDGRFKIGLNKITRKWYICLRDTPSFLLPANRWGSLQSAGLLRSS